jgi:Cu+-exporting ATPase
MFLSASVYYDNSVLTAEEVAEQITDLGYPSKVLEDAVSSNSKQNFWISGMTCASCVNKIEANLAAMKGIESCSVSLPTAVACVEYIPSVVGPRDIIERIEVCYI